jgi:hypothetical protein
LSLPDREVRHNCQHRPCCYFLRPYIIRYQVVLQNFRKNLKIRPKVAINTMMLWALQQKECGMRKETNRCGSRIATEKGKMQSYVGARKFGISLVKDAKSGCSYQGKSVHPDNNTIKLQIVFT